MAGITLLAIAAIGVTYFFISVQVDSANSFASTARERAALYDAAGSGAVALLQASETHYLSPSESHAASLAGAADRLDALATAFSDDPEVMAALSPLAGSAKGIADAVAVMGLSPDAGLQGALRGAVHEVEALIKQETDAGKALDPLLLEMLTLRRNEKDLMLRVDPKYVETFGASFARFTSVLASLSDPALSAKVTPLADAYRTHFLAYADGLFAARDALSAFTEAEHQAAELLAQRLDLAQADNLAAEASAEQLQNLTALSLIIAFVLATIGSVGLAFVVGRSIRGQLGQLEGTMARFANGNYEGAVPMTARKDELGRMARALEVFQQNGLTVAALGLEEAERAREAAARATMMRDFQSAFDEVIQAASDGNFSRRIDREFADQDINRISQNFNVMLASVERGVGETGTVLSALANTDLTLRVEGEYRGVMAQLKADANAVADKLAEVLGQLRDTSRSLKNATGEILAGANDLSERTTRQAATIEETSAAMEQLASTIADNAVKAADASARAVAATDLAGRGGKVMAQANQAMERITQSSTKISDIIGLIDDIAFQTNLLALNASVEAARAGEAGKGFAVVAVEVRRLAQNAAEASSDIKQLIETSVSEVSDGTRLVTSAASTLKEILDAVAESSGLIQTISVANSEQASSVSEVTQAVRVMDEMTQHNAALVEEVNASIEQTEAQASELDRIVDVFKLKTAAVTPMPRPVLQHRSHGNAAIKQDWNEF